MYSRVKYNSYGSALADGAMFSWLLLRPRTCLRLGLYLTARDLLSRHTLRARGLLVAWATGFALASRAMRLQLWLCSVTVRYMHITLVVCADY
jgi:hypothetical protein